MKRPIILLLVSILTLAYWVTASTINVYGNTFMGGLFEFLWMPMVACLGVLPALSFYFWVKEKYGIYSVYLLSLLINGAALVFVLVLK